MLPLEQQFRICPPSPGINQVQANEYLEDSGIGAHVEEPKGSFGRGVSCNEPATSWSAPGDKKQLALQVCVCVSKQTDDFGHA